MCFGEIYLMNHRPFVDELYDYKQQLVRSFFRAYRARPGATPEVGFGADLGFLSYNTREISYARFGDLVRKHHRAACNGESINIYDVSESLFIDFIEDVKAGSIKMPEVDERVFEARYDLGLSYSKVGAHAGATNYSARKLLDNFDQDAWERYKDVVYKRIPYRQVFSSFQGYIHDHPRYSPVMRTDRHSPRKGDFVCDGGKWYCLKDENVNHVAYCVSEDKRNKGKEGTAFISWSTFKHFVPREHVNYLHARNDVVYDFDGKYQRGQCLIQWGRKAAA